MPDEQEKVPSFDEGPVNTLPDTSEPASDPLANSDQPEQVSNAVAGTPVEPLEPPAPSDPVSEDLPQGEIRKSWAESRNILQ